MKTTSILKRPISFICIQFFFILNCFSQNNIIEEPFNSATLPTNWSSAYVAGSLGGWQFNNPAVRSIGSPFSGNFAILDSDHYGNIYSNTGWEDASITTKAFFSHYTGAIILEYDYQYREWNGPEGATVEVFNGSSWTIIKEYGIGNSNYPAVTHERIDITDICQGYSSWIKFRYWGTNDYYFAIDNVVVKAFSNYSYNTAPAGVGATNGGTELTVWLDADDINGNGIYSDNPVSSTPVSIWKDKSGYNNDFSNTPSFQPSMQSVNGLNVVRFDPNQSNAQFLNGINIDAYRGGSVFAVVKAYDGNSNTLLNDTKYSVRLEQWLNTNKAGFTSYGIADYASTLSTQLNQTSIYSFKKPYNSSTLTTTVGANSISLSVGTPTAGIPVKTLGVNGVNGRANYDLSELLIYDKNLSQVSKIMIENYLSAKHGGLPIPYDIYTNDTPANGNFDYNVAGLGKSSDGSVLEKSMGTGIFKIWGASNLDANEYLVWGENIKHATYEFVPSNQHTRRMNTVYRVNEIGEVGLVSVLAPIARVDLSLKPSCGKLNLIIASDPNFTNKTVYPMGRETTYYEDSHRASPIDFNDFDYFTLEYITEIALDNNVFYNGSGTANGPNNQDACFKFLVNSNSNGSVSLSENATVLSVEVETGGVLQIDSGVTLTVNENIINNGQIILAYGAHIIQKTTGLDANTGTGTYIVNIKGNNSPYKYNIWSSPIKAADIPTVFTTTNPCDIFAFDHPTQTWKYDYALNTVINCGGNNYTMTSNNLFSGSDGVMDIGRGYFVPGKAANTRIFNGKINNGDLSIPVSATSLGNNSNWDSDDWNLIGNPYPSAISAKKFWAVNSSNITSALYFWDDADTSGGYNQYNDYASWNLMGGINSGNSSRIPNGQIAPGQGFWFYTSSTTNVIFNNDMRSDTAALQFKTTNSDRHLSWISFTSPQGYKNNILVGYNNLSTDGIDKQFDAHKLVGNAHVRFASIIDNQEFSIQGVAPINIGSQKIIPLVVFTDSTGSHTFKMYRTENIPSNFKIYLNDLLLGKTTDLTQTEYTVSLNGNQEYLNRFELVFVNDINHSGGGSGTKGGNGGSDSTVTGIADYTNSNFVLTQTEGEIMISNPSGFSGNLFIYDILGKTLFQMNDIASTESLSISTKQFPAGTYILNLVNGKINTYQRKFFKK